MRALDELRRQVRSSSFAAPVRLARLNLIARTTGHQDLSALARAEWQVWEQACAVAERGKRVLIATNMGGHFGLSAVDRVLAIALTLRGAHVTTALCDHALPACHMDEVGLVPRLAVDGQPSLLCGYCYAPAANAVRSLGLPLSVLSDFVDHELRSQARALANDTASTELSRVVWRGLRVGEHALAGALRYCARSDLNGKSNGERLLRRYVEASVIAAGAYFNAIDALKPDVVVAHHGIYVPQGLAVAVAQMLGVRVVTWNPAYRRHCFIFSHDDTYHHTLMNEPAERWRDAPFDEAMRAQTLRYLKGRRSGDDDWIRFHPDPDYAVAERLVALGVDLDKPMVLALTNVFWDAQLHYPANGFASQREWLIETVRSFAARPDLQLVIRVHPAELSGAPPSRQHAVDELSKAFPVMPTNIALVGPEDPLSTYKLAERANAALIYATKMGVELSAVGLPVIVAGEAWVRDKGFTTDVSSPDAYRAALALLPLSRRLDPQAQDLALRYAHHFFFRRMIEVPFIERDRPGGGFSAHVKSLGPLGAGGTPGLDVICDGILAGAPFEA